MHFIGNIFNKEITLGGTRPITRQRSAIATGNPVSFPWALHCHISPLITLHTMRETLKRLPVQIPNLVTANQVCLDTLHYKQKYTFWLNADMASALCTPAQLGMESGTISGVKWKVTRWKQQQERNKLGIPVSPEMTASVSMTEPGKGNPSIVQVRYH